MEEIITEAPFLTLKAQQPHSVIINYALRSNKAFTIHSILIEQSHDHDINKITGLKLQVTKSCEYKENCITT